MPRRTNRRRSHRDQITGLPDVTRWTPKLHSSESLHEAFFNRCRQIEKEVLGRVAYEKGFAEHSFDSGWVVEETIREALRELLPTRYSVRAGSLSDAKGYIAGDCDIVIFNDEWFPAIKLGPSKDSRKAYLPIEGAYAVLEVKQTLTRRTLEDAMRKLVICHRLFRPAVSLNRIVENDTRNACTHFVSNPLFSAIVAAGLSDGLDMDRAVEHFVRINQQLGRRDVVRALCILGNGTVRWAHRPEQSGVPTQMGELRPASFMLDDRYSELVPVYGRTKKDDSPFYDLVQELMSHIFKSVLGPEDVAVHYGSNSPVRIPTTDGATLTPDSDMLESLNESCVGKHVCTEHAYR